MKRVKIALFLSMLCPNIVWANDDIGYYGFYQYRDFGAKMSVDYFPPNNNADPTSAKRYFSGIQSKQLSVLKNTTRTAKEALGYGDWNKPYRIMFGLEQDVSHHKTSASSYGSKDAGYNAFWLMDKQMAPAWRLGFGLTFNQINADYNPAGLGFEQQGVITSWYSLYQTGGFRLRNILYLGGGKGQTKRLGNDTYEAEFDTRYLAIENNIRQTIELGNYFYLQPAAELNYYQVERNAINEGRGFYVGEQSNYQVEGLAAIFVGGKYKGFDLKFGPELNHIFSDPKKAYTLFDETSNPIFMAKKYDQKDYITYKTYLTYKAENGLGFYADYRYYERKNDNIVWTLGVNYKF